MLNQLKGDVETS